MRALWSSRFMIVLLAVVCWALGGCQPGGQESGAWPERPSDLKIPDDVANLVPKEALAYLQFASLEQMDAAMAAVATSLGESPPSAMDDMLEVYGLSRGRVDQNRPFAAVYTTAFALAGAPVPLLIMPFHDVKGELQRLEEMPQTHVRASGDYLVIGRSEISAPTSGATSLLEPLPAGVLAGRINLEAVLAQVRPFLEIALGQAAARVDNPAIGLQQKAMMQWLRLFMDSAKQLEFGIVRENTQLDIAARFVTIADSPLAVSALSAEPNLVELAACLPREYPLAYLFSADPSIWMPYMETYREMMTALHEEAPAEQAEWMGLMQAMFDQGLAMYEDLDADQFGAGQLTADGYEAVQIYTTQGPADAALARWVAFFQGEVLAAMGVVVKDLGESENAGVKLRRLVMDFDFERLGQSVGSQDAVDRQELSEMQEGFARFFGAEGLKVSLAAHGRRLASIIGDDETLVTAAVEHLRGDGGAAARTLQAEVAGVGDKPIAYVRMELRALMSGVFAMMRSLGQESEPLPVIPAGEAVEIRTGVAIQGKDYHKRALLDLAEVMQLIRSIKD